MAEAPKSDVFEHHPTIRQIRPFCGEVATAFTVNFLGMVHRGYQTEHFDEPKSQDFISKKYVETELPSLDEEYFEYVDLAESVLSCATTEFTMIELGAGWGRWLLNAVGIIRQLCPHLTTRLVGVEAEPQHYKWMLEAFADNGVKFDREDLIHAAIGAEEEDRFFMVGNSSSWWGQQALDRESSAKLIHWFRDNRGLEDIRPYQVVEFGRATRLAYMPVVVLSKLVRRFPIVDLIDMDIQDAEREVIPEAIGALNERVKRIHIGTHSREGEAIVRQTFLDHGWRQIWDFGCMSQVAGVTFQDGVQSWGNPRL